MRQDGSDIDSLAGDVLALARRRVLPALRSRVAELPARQRLWAEFQLGWSDVEGNPVAGGRTGKGLRPALVYAAAEAAGATVPNPDRLDRTAAAVELVHTFCIFHDDVIDEDRERRGRPTVWAQFGLAAALLGGDALLASALRCLDDGELVGRMCAAVQELIWGEVLDVEYESRRDLTPADYLVMARLKTGALMGAACALGAAVAGAPSDRVARMDRFGHCLGVAFQIADDLLGVFGDPAVVGKPVGSDLRPPQLDLPGARRPVLLGPGCATAANPLRRHGDCPMTSRWPSVSAPSNWSAPARSAGKPRSQHSLKPRDTSTVVDSTRLGPLRCRRSLARWWIGHGDGRGGGHCRWDAR